MGGPVELEVVAWLRRRIAERKYLAEHAIELGANPEWHEQSSGVLVTGPETDADAWSGFWPMGDSTLTRLMEANDPQDTIARCEAELAILDLHAIIWRDIGWLHDDGGEESAEIPVCGSCVPKHSHFRRRADVPEGPCRTALLVAAGYRHYPGYRQAWHPDKSQRPSAPSPL